MQPIIRVDQLGKRYRIGYRAPYNTLRESMVNVVRRPFRSAIGRLRGASSTNGETKPYVWALRDVSFEVKQGEVLGIIGRNGAGKSTLLKILSRITEPTTGRVELRGRVGSLLEVGTGFHPELTGRENIYLSGAILGMRRAEINRKFDEIVSFAEVEKFIDTPAKHFSSGMYVRLAFAVAAHLEPEILLVDEVLAVGDVAFQKKCIGKMGDVANQGRTVLFISHNMTAVESLCHSCILINNGRMEAFGETGEVVNRYMAHALNQVGSRSLIGHPGRRRGSRPIMTHVDLCNATNGASGTVAMNSPFSLSVSYRAERPIRPVLGLQFRTGDGAPVFDVSDRYAGQLIDCEPSASGIVTCAIERLPLMPGTYVVDLFLGDPFEDLDVIHEAATFEVLPADVLGTGRLPPSSAGPFFCTGKFTLERNGFGEVES